MAAFVFLELGRVPSGFPPDRQTASPKAVLLPILGNPTRQPFERVCVLRAAYFPAFFW
jgi:hypothetical protein